MEHPKMIASVSITPIVKEASMRLATYNGFRSFSELVETLLIDWLNEKSPDWFKETQEYLAVQKVDEKEKGK